MTVSIPSDLPPDYRPYSHIKLCGNTFLEVGAIFRIGNFQPFLIGRGPAGHPNVWLFARFSSGSWHPVVAANVAVMPSLPETRRIAVIVDADRPQTIVTAGSVIVVSAKYDAAADGVDVSALDLRPLGLNIHGDDHIGLLFANSLFVGNTMKGVGTAFAASM
jgi:hypothetical protein